MFLSPQRVHPAGAVTSSRQSFRFHVARLTGAGEVRVPSKWNWRSTTGGKGYERSSSLACLVRVATRKTILVSQKSGHASSWTDQRNATRGRGWLDPAEREQNLQVSVGGSGWCPTRVCRTAKHGHHKTEVDRREHSRRSTSLTTRSWLKTMRNLEKIAPSTPKRRERFLEDIGALDWCESVNSTPHRAHLTRVTHAIFLCARASRCLRVVVVLSTFHLIHHLAWPTVGSAFLHTVSYTCTWFVCHTFVALSCDESIHCPSPRRVMLWPADWAISSHRLRVQVFHRSQ